MTHLLLRDKILPRPRGLGFRFRVSYQVEKEHREIQQVGWGFIRVPEGADGFAFFAGETEFVKCQKRPRQGLRSFRRVLGIDCCMYTT